MSVLLCPSTTLFSGTASSLNSMYPVEVIETNGCSVELPYSSRMNEWLSKWLSFRVTKIPRQVNLLVFRCGATNSIETHTRTLNYYFFLRFWVLKFSIFAATITPSFFVFEPHLSEITKNNFFVVCIPSICTDYQISLDWTYHTILNKTWKWKRLKFYLHFYCLPLLPIHPTYLIKRICWNLVSNI